ncbi:MAG: DUF3097 domain-containing protein [Propionibacteriaceae bacterium]|nr:DUF3097 domain-containing protein [Propionibacteriaceae bacterium]
MPFDRYPADVLAPGARRPARLAATPLDVARGLVLEDAQSGYCGAVVAWDNGLVVLEDRRRRRRSFPFGPGFLLEGRPVCLRLPSRPPVRGSAYTRSGSLAGPAAPARVAQASRLWVEGKHDAELIERVWGDDLRHIGVVVEPLGGVDCLPERIAEFQPEPGRRLGVLVDHLEPGTKETRIADQVAAGPYGGHVLVLGHRHIDIWQAVEPASLGLPAWPEIPRGVDFKQGTCRALGWPWQSPADLAQAWRRILNRVESWRDLDRAFVTNVERLIDFAQEG